MALIVLLCLPIIALGVNGAAAAEARRTAHTVAIRLSLGATPRLLQRQLQWRIVTVVGCGIFVGLAAGFASGMALAKFVFGVQGVEPLAALVVAAVTLTVSWFGSLPSAAQLVRDDVATLLRGL